MKKTLFIALSLALILVMAMPSLAQNDERAYMFELSIDGGDFKQVKTGDIITVVFTLIRTDAEEEAQMYAMQNEICYDTAFFEAVEGSEMISEGIIFNALDLRDGMRAVYMNFLSLSGGEQWNARRLIGSFQLKVKASEGQSTIINNNYMVSTQDGMDEFAAQSRDVTVGFTSAPIVIEGNLQDDAKNTPEPDENEQAATVPNDESKTVNESAKTPWWAWAALGVGGAAIALALAVIIKEKQRKARKRRRKTAKQNQI